MCVKQPGAGVRRRQEQQRQNMAYGADNSATYTASLGQHQSAAPSASALPLP